MAHKCEGALITCEDFRLHQRKDGRNYISQFIKEQAVDCDLITRAGGVQDIVRPGWFLFFRRSVLRDAKVSVKLHQAKVIYLINHEDCGAYSKLNFSTREEELNQHYKDLRQAKKIKLKRFPNKEIKMYFAELEENTEDVYIIKEIEE